MSVGQIAGQVHDIVSVTALIEQMVQGAKAIFGPDNDFSNLIEAK